VGSQAAIVCRWQYEHLYYGKCTGKREFTLYKIVISAKHVPKVKNSHWLENLD
jgi:hypothetical protein